MSVVNQAGMVRTSLEVGDAGRVGQQVVGRDWETSLASFFGASGTNRTCDPLLRREMLYPLSYGGAGIRGAQQSF